MCAAQKMSVHLPTRNILKIKHSLSVSNSIKILENLNVKVSERVMSENKNSLKTTVS